MPLCATHGLFSGEALDRLDHAHIEEIVVTDSIVLPDHHHCKMRLKVRP